MFGLIILMFIEQSSSFVYDERVKHFTHWYQALPHQHVIIIDFILRPSDLIEDFLSWWNEKIIGRYGVYIYLLKLKLRCLMVIVSSEIFLFSFVLCGAQPESQKGNRKEYYSIPCRNHSKWINVVTKSYLCTWASNLIDLSILILLSVFISIRFVVSISRKHSRLFTVKIFKIICTSLFSQHCSWYNSTIIV